MYKTGDRIDFANTLRGFAAVSVIIAHYCYVFWADDYRDTVGALINAPSLSLSSHAFPSYLYWLNAFPLFTWGGYGVALFFIISGFVIPFSLQKLNGTRFLINRILRIYPCYAIGFSITLLAIIVCSRYFQRTFPYSPTEILIHYIPGLRDVLWSAPIDGIVWTLEIEVKFYIVCAVLVTWFRKASLKVFLAPVLLFLLFFATNKLNLLGGGHTKIAFVFAMVSQYIIYMFIGVVFNYLYRQIIAPDRAYLYIGGLFALFCIHWWMGPYSGSLGVAWSYAFALLTFSFAYSFPHFFGRNTVFNFFADISYPLYVIHGIAGYVALRIMLDLGFKAWISLLVTTSAAVLLAWLLHVLVEQPFRKFGKYIDTKFGQL